MTAYTEDDEDFTIFAIRVDSETGETEFLLGGMRRQPEWVPISKVKFATS